MIFEMIYTNLAGRRKKYFNAYDMPAGRNTPVIGIDFYRHQIVFSIYKPIFNRSSKSNTFGTRGPATASRPKNIIIRCLY